MTLSAIIDAIQDAELKRGTGNLELYRREVWVDPSPRASAVQLSLIDISPENPQHTLVLIHGFAANSDWWNYQIPSLAQKQRVIAIDLRGHGRSGRPGDGFTIAQLAEDVVLALDRLEVPKPWIPTGHSSGGLIAVEIALRYPEQVEKLILIATPLEIKSRLLPWAAQLFMSYPEWLMRLIQPIYKLDSRGRGGASLVSLRRLFADLNRWNGGEKFPKVSQPTLVIIGDRDYALPEAYFHRVSKLIPDSKVVNIGASKHQIPLERPKAVLRTIEHFLATQGKERIEPLWRTENDDFESVQLLAERPWIARYEEGVPRTLNLPNITIQQILRITAHRAGKQAAIRWNRQTLTYSELTMQITRFVAVLTQLGIKSGDRVMFILPALPQFIIAYFGVLEAGCVPVLCNPDEDERTIIQQCEVILPRILLAHHNQETFARYLQEKNCISCVLYVAGNGYTQSRYFPWFESPQKSIAHTDLSTPLEASHHDASPDTHPESPGLIAFSSGTSSAPKAVQLSQRNLVASTLQLSSWLTDLRFGREKILCAAPLSHTFGLTFGINLAVSIGASMIVPETLEPQVLLQKLKAEKPSVLLATPAVMIQILEYPELGPITREHLRICISATAPLPVEIKESFERITKALVIESYGLSEACHATHMNPPSAYRTGSIGLPLPGTEAKIISFVDETPLPWGEIGELAVRGPQVMNGDWLDPHLQHSVIDAEGWLHTSDAARMDDDGYFQVFGPINELWRDDVQALILPRDIEEVIIEIPEVKETAVVACQNQPVAFVCLHAGVELASEVILEYCRERLPANHMPRQVIFIEKLPRSPIGKVLKRELTRRCGIMDTSLDK